MHNNKMFKEISQHWNQFRKYPSGERFERYYRSRHDAERSATKKTLLIGAGIVIMAAGVVFLAIPGPGLVVMLIGAGLIARESLVVSRIFDRIEPHACQLAKWCRATWRRLSPGVKALLIVSTVLLAAAIMLGAYKIFYG
jgi:hypothetical protein